MLQMFSLVLFLLCEREMERETSVLLYILPVFLFGYLCLLSVFPVFYFIIVMY